MAEILKRNTNEETDGESQFSSLPGMSIGSGDQERICPACEKGLLKYDYFLNLYCDSCGYVEASCFT